MTTETAAKRDTQKLQRAIVDGLEDVKAQDIQVFDTEHLSPLFERVIVASGTSNRQTKALAASVVDAVREAGFAKPRVEGEGNGEWIIVDCAQAVVHIMQPAFRTYYHLEELWGEKPVRLKFGATRPPVAAKPAAPEKSGKPAKSATRKQVSAGKAPTRKAPVKIAEARPQAATKVPAKTAVKAPAKGRSKAAPARKVAAAPAGAPAKKAAARPVAKAPAAKKPAARKTPSRA